LSSSVWFLVSGAVSKDYVLGFYIINGIILKSKRVSFLKEREKGLFNLFEHHGCGLKKEANSLLNVQDNVYGRISLRNRKKR
jgi:hypothetical protein